VTGIYEYLQRFGSEAYHPGTIVVEVLIIGVVVYTILRFLEGTPGAGLLKGGQGELEVVAPAVVEGEGNRPGGEGLPGGEARDDLGQGKDAEVVAEPPEVLPKGLGGHVHSRLDEAGAGRGPGQHAVVHEDHGAGAVEAAGAAAVDPEQVTGRGASPAEVRAKGHPGSSR